MEKLRSFFRSIWLWIADNNLLSTNNVFYFTIFAMIVMISIGFVFFSQFGEREVKKNKIRFNFNGDYSAEKRIIAVERGWYVFFVQEKNGFSVLRLDDEDAKFFPIYSETVFLAFSFDSGKVKKMDLKNGISFAKIFIPHKGELKVWVKKDSSKFDPLIDQIWTGDKTYSGFINGNLIFNLKKADKPYPWIPEVVDVPKKSSPQAAPEAEKPTAEKDGKSFFDFLKLPDLSGDDEEEGFFETPLSEEDQKKIKNNFKESWKLGGRLLKDFFSPDEKGEEGEEK